MLAFAVLLAAVTGAAAPPPPMMAFPSTPVMRPVVVQPAARPVAPAPPAPHLSGVKPQSVALPDPKKPQMPEMKKPYNSYYYGAVRWPTVSCSNVANLVWLTGGSWCNDPAVMACCPRPLLVP
jgi:hypothetical protein